MDFKQGDRVELILRSKKRVGTVEDVYNDNENYNVQLDGFPVSVARPGHCLMKVEDPELIVVPRFAADWLNHCKQREYDLACLLDYGNAGIPDEMYEWLISSADNQELLARAWLDGYEVEKEPLYYVMLPYLDAEKEINYAYILVNITDNKTQPSLSNCISREWKAELTEAQIKGMPGGDIYWQFAVLVEEVEGEDNE
ncbi:DUF1642 domain-containing protein [Listeria monocytogenes]|nr:DUF1642 domain-containing protein [Listeria monocytogenes]